MDEVREQAIKTQAELNLEEFNLSMATKDKQISALSLLAAFLFGVMAYSGYKIMGL